MALHRLQNEHWQSGILPQTGASVAFGRVKIGSVWRDVLRPTAESDYGNSSKCSSFIMMPWCNRIKNGVLCFRGESYSLRTEKDDGTARHGDVRKRTWDIIEADGLHIRLHLVSSAAENVNFPFRFSGEAEYRLEGRDFVWRLTLHNDDTRPMPGGFGHHPYFVRDPLTVQIPCAAMFELVDFLAVAPPVPIPPQVDFRAPKTLGEYPYNDLLTERNGDEPAVIAYDGLTVQMTSDPIFKHYLIYAPENERTTFALEPMTNVNDAFNLAEQGIEQAGVFVLQPGESASGEMRLTLGKD